MDQTNGWSIVSMKRLTIFVVLLGLIFLTIGLVIGAFSINTGNKNNDTTFKEQYEAFQKKMDRERLNEMIDQISKERLENNLEKVSKDIHLAGKKENNELGEYIKSVFERTLGNVLNQDYQIELNYPNLTDTNKVTLSENDGTIIMKSQVAAIAKGKLPAFNGFSPSGDYKTKDVIYANYGRREDFMKLTNLNIKCDGKLILIRYGHIFRGDKLNHAAKAGAVGVILYSDPKDYAKNYNGTDHGYPETKWMPGDALQRGSVLLGQGDPSTPLYPSTDECYRKKFDEQIRPKIPIMPISFNDAQFILESMSGDEVEDEWKGSLVNVTYRYGGKLIDDRELELNVNMVETTSKITNVIGQLEGSVYPDEYIIIGAHRDAWTFGAVDPGTGTTVLLEVAETLGTQIKDGWRPKRSIIFCSWDAEEYGLIGSTEWVEENFWILNKRAVAYLNLDVAVMGTKYVDPSANPMMKKLLLRSMNRVLNAKYSQTLYQEYVFEKNKKKEKKFVPDIRPVAAGSDFASFAYFAGVPSCDLRYNGETYYTTYHSIYDNFAYVKRFLDPDFEGHRAITELQLIMLMEIADSILLPYNLKDYGIWLDKQFNEMNKTYGAKLRAIDDERYGKLTEIVKKVSDLLTDFQEQYDSLDTKFIMDVIRTNRRLVEFEKALLDPIGSGGDGSSGSNFKHVLASPSSFNTYASSIFPSLLDGMYNYENEKDESKKKLFGEQLQKSLATLIHWLRSASKILSNDFNRFS
ncbi:hypothetical protein SNEBB_004399 [Seison nebaliae]|nr:hypothetical protein SNEBB_004399 [Seison nebaliae]